MLDFVPKSTIYLLAILRVRGRMGRCCAELHDGIVLMILMLLSLATTDLRGKVGKISPPKQSYSAFHHNPDPVPNTISN